MTKYFGDFKSAIGWATDLVLQSPEVDTGRWQGVPTEGRPDMVTHEALNVSFSVPVARGCALPDEDKELDALAREIQPNLPWADDHFEERVSRVPSNPGEQYKNWPWWHGQELAYEHPSGGGSDARVIDPLFTHTYQERFWPKRANYGRQVYIGDKHYREDNSRVKRTKGLPRRGIRYAYGDLDDVVNLLVREPYTRQATFPIFFPEDTGAVHGGRIPCTLHYHFLMRNDQLHMWYPIRSCDLVRHFRDDLYMACRLMLWVIEECQEEEAETEYRNFRYRTDDPPWGLGKEPDEPRYIWRDVKPGYLHFTTYSLHVHKGDLHHVSDR